MKGKNKMKKVLFLVLTIVLLVSLSVIAAAKPTPEIAPLWDNTRTIESSFDFDGANSNAYANIVGKSGTTKIEATLKVYKLVDNTWTYITETSATAYSSIMSITTPFAATTGTHYKSILVLHVTNSSGVTESLQRATLATG